MMMGQVVDQCGAITTHTMCVLHDGAVTQWSGQGRTDGGDQCQLDGRGHRYRQELCNSIEQGVSLSAASSYFPGVDRPGNPSGYLQRQVVSILFQTHN